MKDNRLEELFSHTPDIPDKLSSKAMMEEIEKKNIRPKKISKGFGVELIAAVFAVIIVAGIVVGNNLLTKPTAQDKETTVQTADGSAGNNSQASTNIPENGHEPAKGIIAIENEEQLKKYFEEIKASDVHIKGENYVYFVGEQEDSVDEYMGADSNMAPTNVATETINGSVNRDDDKNYTGTNTQNSVDEGDIIKNDGRYIYVAGKGFLTIQITDTETMQKTASLSYKKEGHTVALYEIYVSGDTMTVIYSERENKSEEGYRYYGGYYNYHINNETKADIYDISDRSKPKKLRTLTQDGYFLTSRMVGDKLYMVTNFSKTIEEDEEYYLPEINGENVPYTSVVHFDEKANVYTVISGTDIREKDAKTQSLSILTSSSDIYCSENNIYLLTRYYGSSSNKTLIRKIALENDKISCVATGEVLGTYDDKYSFDEYEGKLRAVTTYYDFKEYRNKCALYIFNERLEETGKVDDITDGLDEQVKAVRFMGEKAYVITFEQTDPLFIIDLSDEKSPKVAGELYMPGYSTYLHPLGDTLLMGIGYGGDESGADMGKLKIALFDVSDMTKPAILDEYVIKSSNSEANYEPKALIHFPAKNIIGIPVTVYNSAVYASGETQSFAVITYSDNKLSSVEGFVHERDSRGDYYGSFFRGTCIGDRLYTVDDFMIIEHSLTKGEKLRECEFFTAEDIEKMTENKGMVVVTSSAELPG